jgi:predicted RNase H-like nuclease (RuvC/YqgF family)
MSDEYDGTLDYNERVARDAREHRHQVRRANAMSDIATGRMKEFDPTQERHYPLLIVKAVEPGCTTEIQIEDIEGHVVRLTTTDDSAVDDDTFERELVAAFRRAWRAYARRQQ